MNKIELLAPAGNLESLKAAIQNGADAIYLGGSLFGARASANNFNIEEMREAIAIAHGYGVKIYVTMNTLIKDDEFKQCMETVDMYYRMNVDALIIQDLGLLHQVRQRYPNFELHASTQMHIHTVEGLEVLKRWGIERGVVARETSLDVIKEMAKVGIDLEVFVYGAYCVSYSGQCLMSSSIGHRSGNRGECAQTCRLPYKLIQEIDGVKKEIKTNGNYLLSPKDLNTLEIVPQLIESGITSFKIEGRMKRPEYVALITSLYRKAIDSYFNHESFNVDESMREEMQKVFNRGFTLGHLMHKKGSQLMSQIRPNHVGIEIGEVVKMSKERFTVKLHHDLYQGDGIRILNEQGDVGFVVNYLYKNENLVNQGYAGELIDLGYSVGVKVGAKVLKTSDCKQLAELNKRIESNQRRIPINGMITLKKGEPVLFKVSDSLGLTTEIKSDEIVGVALKTPLEKERVATQLNKTKSTPFDFAQLSIEMDSQITFPISKLNELRRVILEKHFNLRSNQMRERIINELLPMKPVQAKPIQLNVSVSTYEQYKCAIECGINSISVIKQSLYDRIMMEDEKVMLVHERVKKHPYLETTGIIQEVGGLNLKADHSASPALNTMNAYTASVLFNEGCSSVTFSLECSLAQAKTVCNNFQQLTGSQGNFEAVVYGRVENMISEACPINTNILDNDKKNCSLCKGKNRYYLVDGKQKSYPLYGDDDCCLHIYHSETLNEIDSIKEYQKFGVSQFRCILVDEDSLESKQVLMKAMKAIGGNR